MEVILLASLLSCSDGAFILEGLNVSRISDSTRSEIRIEIIQSMPDNCAPEEYNPWRKYVTEGTGKLKRPFTFRLMSVATYRGIKYDTAKFAQRGDAKTVVETYRGVKHTEQVRIQKWISYCWLKNTNRRSKSFLKLNWLWPKRQLALFVDMWRLRPPS